MHWKGKHYRCTVYKDRSSRPELANWAHGNRTPKDSYLMQMYTRQQTYMVATPSLSAIAGWLPLADPSVGSEKGRGAHSPACGRIIDCLDNGLCSRLGDRCSIYIYRYGKSGIDRQMPAVQDSYISSSTTNNLCPLHGTLATCIICVTIGLRAYIPGGTLL